MACFPSLRWTQLPSSEIKWPNWGVSAEQAGPSLGRTSECAHVPLPRRANDTHSHARTPPPRSRGNNLGRGKGGTFGPLQHLGGDADPHRRGTAGQPRDTSHRVRHGAGFNTSSKKGGLFGTFEYMADGGPDSWKEAQGGASARRRGARSKPHLADKHAKGTFGAFPAHMSDPYQDRPAHPGKGAKGAIYTFTVHYHRSARPNTSGAGRVRGRTTAQMGEYTRTRVRSGRPLHTTTSLGHSSAR